MYQLWDRDATESINLSIAGSWSASNPLQLLRRLEVTNSFLARIQTRLDQDYIAIWQLPTQKLPLRLGQSISLHVLVHLAVLFSLVWTCIFTIQYMQVLVRRRKLPPGPFPFPVVGSGVQISGQHPWVAFERIAQKYDSSMYVACQGPSFLKLVLGILPEWRLFDNGGLGAIARLMREQTSAGSQYGEDKPQ